MKDESLKDLVILIVAMMAIAIGLYIFILFIPMGKSQACNIVDDNYNALYVSFSHDGEMITVAKENLTPELDEALDVLLDARVIHVVKIIN